MKKPILVTVFCTFLGTSLLWVTGLAGFLWGAQPADRAYLAVFSMKSNGDVKTAFVVDELDEQYTTGKSEGVRREVPSGDMLHFGIRLVASQRDGN